MDFVRNLEGKRWWIDGICKGGRTLERETKVREISDKMRMGVETPKFQSSSGRLGGHFQAPGGLIT